MKPSFSKTEWGGKSWIDFLDLIFCLLSEFEEFESHSDKSSAAFWNSLGSLIEDNKSNCSFNSFIAEITDSKFWVISWILPLDLRYFLKYFSAFFEGDKFGSKVIFKILPSQSDNWISVE